MMASRAVKRALYHSGLLALARLARQRVRGLVLRYHAITEGESAVPYATPGICLPVEAFGLQMAFLRRAYSVVGLDALTDALAGGCSLPPRSVAITFDDGYADNEELAARILQRQGVSATFFVSTGFLGSGCMWNDRVIEAIRACEAARLDLSALGLGNHPLGSIHERRHAIASLLAAIKHYEPARRETVTKSIAVAAGDNPAPALMMAEQQVRSLRTLGMDVGAHTVTHPILTRVSRAAAHNEMSASKSELERLLGEPVRLFAYPNGVPVKDYAAEHTELACDCGFIAAVSTAWGAASARSDRYQLPRFTPWDSTRLRYGARLLANFTRTEQVAARGSAAS